MKDKSGTKKELLAGMILSRTFYTKQLTFLKRKPIGLTNRSNFTGFLVNVSPTYVTFVTIRFQPFLRVLPVFKTLKASASLTALTAGRGTWYLPYKTLSK